MNARLVGACLAIAAVSTAAACASKQAASRPQPSQSLTVLLPDSDGKSTGAAHVSNTFGSIELATEHDAALALSDRSPVLRKLSPSEIERIFGAALSALPPAPRRFTLNFRFESDELTEQSQALIPQILSAVKEYVVHDVVVIGHTDTMGTQQANYGLGLKRAMTIRSLLVQAGLDGSTIDVTSVGELDPLVKTPDETPEPRNRRVEISVR